MRYIEETSDLSVIGASKICRFCKTRQRLKFETDGQGRLLERPLACGCEARYKLGVCIECPNPVEGVVGRSMRCGSCRKAAKLEYGRKFKRMNPGKTKGYQKKYRNANRERLNTSRLSYGRWYGHNYLTKHVGVGCKPPTCKICAVVLPYRRGRPRNHCAAHRTTHELGLEKRRKRIGWKRVILTGLDLPRSRMRSRKTLVQ